MMSFNLNRESWKRYCFETQVSGPLYLIFIWTKTLKVVIIFPVILVVILYDPTRDHEETQTFYK